MKNKFFRLNKTAAALHQEITEHRSSFLVYIILRVLVILMLCLQIAARDFENILMCLLTLILLMIPAFAQVTFKIELPTLLEIVILCFIFAAQILGELCHFYHLIPFWDTILHTINGFLASAIGFSLINILNKNENKYFHLSPLFVVIVTFCFSMTIGVLWEFFEFGMDHFFEMNTQKDTLLQNIHIVSQGVSVKISDISAVMIYGGSDQMVSMGGYVDIGLYDTMIDLIVNFAGAFVFSVLSYLYIKKPDQIMFLKKIIPYRKK